MNALLNLWISTAVFIILGAGLLFDIVFVMLYWDKFVSLFRERLKLVPWDIRDVFNICLRLFAIYATLNISEYLILKIFTDEKEIIHRILNVINGIVMYGAGTWIMVYSIKSKYNSNLNQMGINMLLWVKKSVQSIAIYAGFFPVLMVVAYIGVLFCFYIGVSPEAHPLVDILKEGQPGLFILYIVTIAVIFAPVFEEILFRGLFYQSLKKRFGLWQAAIISSVLFSILHFNTAQFLPIFGLGILLCFVFEYTGSLVPVIVLHIFNNAFFLGLFFLIENNS